MRCAASFATIQGRWDASGRHQRLTSARADAAAGSGATCGERIIVGEERGQANGSIPIERKVVVPQRQRCIVCKGVVSVVHGGHHHRRWRAVGMLGAVVAVGAVEPWVPSRAIGRLRVIGRCGRTRAVRDDRCRELNYGSFVFFERAGP